MFKHIGDLYKHLRAASSGNNDTILRDKQQELHALMQSIADGEPDIDKKIMHIIADLPEQKRATMLEKIRNMLRNREQELEQEEAQGQDKNRNIQFEKQRSGLKQWLTWIISDNSLRRLRESFLARPNLENQVKNIGEELAKKGVLAQMQLAQQKDLGDLSAGVAKQQSAQKGKSGLGV